MKLNVVNAVYLILIVVGISLLAFPFLPEITLPVQQYIHSKEQIETNIKKAAEEAIENKENKIIIPKIFVDAKISESTKTDIDKVLPGGPTRIVESSTPDKSGNTVIVAHRAYVLSGPKTFYHLPKVKNGDEITIIWNQKEYKYKVFNTLITNPEDIKIEANTEENMLTLYTCTPMIDFSKRFIVQAKLVN